MIFRVVMVVRSFQISYGNATEILGTLGILLTMTQIAKSQDLGGTNLCFKYGTTDPTKTMDAIDAMHK